MRELPRLHEEPESELERSLLNAGRSYSASTGTRARTLAALGVVGTTVATTSAAATVTKASVVKWVAATALAVAVAVPAVHYLRKPAPSSPAAAADAAAVTSALGVAARPAANANAAPTSEPRVSSTAGTSETGASPTPMNLPKPVASMQGLTAELAALDAARSALAAGDANGALANLDAYARNFSRGRLGLEAEVLRIDALAKSGQTAAAQKRAQAFIKRHPDSVLASRVRAYAGQ